MSSSTPPSTPPNRPGTTTRPSLASFWHDLPREGRLLLSIIAIEFLGTGLVLPFSVVYLHDVRGFDLGTAGLLLAVPALVSLIVVGPGGVLIDRLGARRIMLTCLSLLVASSALLAYASTPALAAVALALNGVSLGMMWPAANSLIAAVIPERLRQRYFGVNFTLINLGIGLGGVLGGSFVDVNSLVSFQLIYLADAVSYLPAIALLGWPLRHVAGRPVRHELGLDEAPAEVVEGYLAVLRRPAVQVLLVLTFAGAFVGYAQLNAGMPAYATAISEISTRGLGYAFAANTLVIVVLQLVVLQRIEGHRRTRVLAVMGLVWTASWMLLGASGLVPGTLGATLLVAACAAVFGLGETLLQPTIPVITNALAPDHLRGRYNALSSAAFQGAAVVAPPIAGWLIDADLGVVYIVVLGIGSLIVSALAVVRLEPQLSPRVNGLEPGPEVRPGAA